MNSETTPPAKLHQLGDLIAWGAERFDQVGLSFGHGTDNAWDEAAQLVLFALGQSITDTDHDLQRRLSPSEIQVACELLTRRVNERRPAAYLIHEAWFAGLAFYVDERVLVPRSPVAELIEEGLAPWIEADRVESVLDLCAGSGCIGIACAYAFPHTRVDLVDISSDALEVASKNIFRHDIKGRVRAIESDLFEQLQGCRYDVIICNPPYVDAQTMASLPDEYGYEPVQGLAGGREGLDVVDRVLQQASAHLHLQGILIMEVGDSEAALIGRYPMVPFVWLEFEKGGNGVFVLTAEECEQFF
jgi:ribosomal protein L3 glutamine methyltransferase